MAGWAPASSLEWEESGAQSGGGVTMGSLLVVGFSILFGSAIAKLKSIGRRP